MRACMQPPGPHACSLQLCVASREGLYREQLSGTRETGSVSGPGASDHSTVNTPMSKVLCANLVRIW